MLNRTAVIIYDEIIRALENKKPVNINNIRNMLNITDDYIFNQLIEFVDMKLQTSFEYSQRDYNALVRLKTSDIENMICGMQEDVMQIKEA